MRGVVADRRAARLIVRRAVRRKRARGYENPPPSPKISRASTSSSGSSMVPVPQQSASGTPAAGGSGNYEGVGKSDVIVYLKGGYLTSDRSLLMKHSAKFKDMLESQPILNNEKAVVRILTLEVDLFGIINWWLTNETLPKDLALDQCLKLLNPSKTFKITKLREQLVTKIKEMMASKDVFKVFKVAKCEKICDLYEHTVGLICQRPMDFLFMEEFRDLRMSEVRPILDSENLQVDEMQVFKAAIGWARTMSEKPGRRKHETLSYYFRQVLRCVRLPLISPDQVEVLISGHQFDVVASGLMGRIVAALRKENIDISNCPTVKYLKMKWWKRGEKRMFTTDLDENKSNEDEICCVKVAVSRNEDADDSQSFPLSSSEEIRVDDLGGEIERGNFGGCGAKADQSSSIPTDRTSEDVQIPEPNGDDDNDDSGSHCESTVEPMEVVDAVGNVVEAGRCDVIDIAEGDRDELLQLQKPLNSNISTPRNTIDENILVSPPSSKILSGTSNTPVVAEALPSSPRRVRRLPPCIEDKDDCSSNDGNPMYAVIRKPPNKSYSSYSNLVKTFRKTICEQVESIHLVNFRLEDLSTQVDENASIKLDGTDDCIKGENVSDNERIASLLRFIRRLDVTNYLVFTPKSRVVNVEGIWDLKQQILIRFNGITFLSIDHKKKGIILNYLKDCERILSGCEDEIRSIAISNCEWNMSEVSKPNSKLEKLSLYRVWGNFGLRRILRRYPNLKELRIWKWMPSEQNKAEFPKEYSYWLILSFPLETCPFQSLRVLVVENTKIKLRDLFKLDKTVQMNVEILKLRRSQFLPGDCTVEICELLPRLFPRLKRLWMIGILKGKEGYNCDILSVHSVCGAAMSIPSLDWLRVKDLNFIENDEGNCNCNQKVKALLENVGCPYSGDFLMTRTVGLTIFPEDGGWNLTCYDDMKTNSRSEYENMNDTMEMEWHNLGMLFKDLAAFRNYFIQNGINGDEDELKFPVRTVVDF